MMAPDDGIPEASALIIVDVQNDFCPGGALAVPEGDAVVPRLNVLAARFAEGGRPVVATRDWHPPDHVSFDDQGGPWPPHCVQGTEGAAYHPDLELPERTIHVRKGVEVHAEAYSGFLGTDAEGRALAEVLRELGIRRVVVGGLATDYCVKHTVLDALEAGLEVVVATGAVRGVNVAPGDSEAALEEMAQAGAELAAFDDLGAGEGRRSTEEKVTS